MMKDVAIIGAGIAGMATAARLQARGFSTIVLEAHGQPGGCAGFFRRKGFAFDVGATTLVDFESGGVCGELLANIGMLRAAGIRDDRPLGGLVSILIEDTIHSTVDRAPLINAALGITIRGAGLTRASGGMRGFWQRFVAHYRALGGELRLGCAVERIGGRCGDFCITTRRGDVRAAQVVSALPAALTARIAPPAR